MSNENAKRHFKVLVVANNIAWLSLNEQLAKVKEFYDPRCVLEMTVVRTSYTPVYKKLPDGIFVVDPEWYEVNITIPNALGYDLNLFITPMPLSPPTYRGYMNPVNIGPWETTVFVEKETDHVYFDGYDLGPALSHYACHELSHAFYYMLGKQDMTHSYFPIVAGNVLNDFDFATPSAIYAWCRERLLSALLYLRFIQKQRVLAHAADRVA